MMSLAKTLGVETWSFAADSGNNDGCILRTVPIFVSFFYAQKNALLCIKSEFLFVTLLPESQIISFQSVSGNKTGNKTGYKNLLPVTAPVTTKTGNKRGYRFGNKTKKRLRLIHGRRRFR